MKTLKTIPGQNLVLGHRGENLATRIIFSIAPWVETYGPGTAHLLHQRNGDSEPYPVATLQEGTEVSWDVTDGDTALEGYGKYELRYYVAETLVKSSVGETYTMKALQYGAEAPDPIQGWVDHVLEKENEILNAVGMVKEHSEQAAGAAGDALKFANEAGKSASNAQLSEKAAADQAGQAAGSAKEAKDAVEEARKIVDGADVVKSVNGQTPDKSGNVQIEVGSGSGVDVTAKPGQLIRVQSVDENGKPTAWEPVPWGYTEGGMVEIPVSGEWTSNNEYLLQAPIGLEAGKTYVVTWDGIDYEVVATAEVLDGLTGIVLGNFTGETGEPFVIMEADEKTAENIGVYGAAYPYASAGYVDFSIYHNAETVHPIPGKFLPEGVPYVEQGEMVEILPETTLTADEADAGLFVIEGNAPVLEIGKTYTVNWNGVEYKTTAYEFIEDDTQGTYLGNLGAISGDTNTGEPFVAAFVSNGTYTIAMFVALYEATQITISIYSGSPVVHKLDNRCLDMAYVKQTLDVSADTISVNLADIGLEMVNLGRTNGTSMGWDAIYEVTKPIIAGAKVLLDFNYELGGISGTYHGYVTSWELNEAWRAVEATVLVANGVHCYYVKIYIEPDMARVATNAYRLTVETTTASEV